MNIGVVFALALTGAAHAITASGTVPFALGDLSAATPGALTAGTLFTTLSPGIAGDGSGDFDCPGVNCVTSGDPISFAGGTGMFIPNVLVGLQLSFGPALRYEYTATAQLAPSVFSALFGSTQITALSVFTTGTFHDLLGVFDDAPASFGIAMLEGCVVSGGCTLLGIAQFATPPGQGPPVIPEPLTSALIGGGLLALVSLRRFRG